MVEGQSEADMDGGIGCIISGLMYGMCQWVVVRLVLCFVCTLHVLYRQCFPVTSLQQRSDSDPCFKYGSVLVDSNSNGLEQWYNSNT